MTKNRAAASAFLFVLLVAGSVWPQTATPNSQSPANQGSQPARPGTAATQARQQARPWDRIPVPPLPEFKPPVPKRVELPNGMVLFLQEDHELPLISVMARVRGGARLEPAAKVGLVNIYGDVWRTGGTTKMTGNQMDDYLAMRAATIETDGQVDSTTISMNSLKGDFDDVFALFEQLLREPAFREDKLALAKYQMNTNIARRNDDVDDITRREARFLAYGRSNPYARIPEFATVAAVSREDLVNWHKQFVHPNNILLGVVGDFNSAEMEAKLRQTFGSWPRGQAAPNSDVKFDPASPGYYYVSKEDVNQTSVRMLALGIERSNPDYFAVSVMNQVFGGGMSSRLFKNVRTRQGLAYNVGGGVGTAYDHAGITAIGLGTKTSSTADAMKALDQQVQSLLKEPVTQQELKLAKDGILNSFIFSVDTPEKVLAERMAYEFYGYPLDFLERFRAGVEKVTVEDVARAAHKYIQPGKFAVLVVGNGEADKLITGFGPVKTIDITIPAPPRPTGKTASETTSGPADR